MKYTKEEQQKSIEYLRSVLKPGDTVYTVLTHVSSSGMSRDIKCLISTNEAKENGTLMTHETNKPTISHWENCKIVDIGWHVSRALNWPLSKKSDWAVKVSGTGMDMAFHLVYSLASVLFGVGDEAKKYNYVTGRNGDKNPDGDGGYFLKKESL